MRVRYRLLAAFLKIVPVGKHCNGAGLWLIKRADCGAQEGLRITVHGRRRKMGLAGFPTLGLADARKLAAHRRGVSTTNRNPIKERDA